MSTFERDPTTGELNLISGMRSIDDIKAIMLDICYPIGSIYTSTDNTSPQDFLGGTWKSLDGYMLRAATSGVTQDSNTNDGGADSVTVSSVASHNHTQNSHTHVLNLYNCGSEASGYGLGNSGGFGNRVKVGSAAANLRDSSVGTKAINVENGANYTVNTLPKYKNVYMWERTA